MRLFDSPFSQRELGLFISNAAIQLTVNSCIELVTDCLKSKTQGTINGRKNIACFKIADDRVDFELIDYELCNFRIDNGQDHLSVANFI